MVELVEGTIDIPFNRFRHFAHLAFLPWGPRNRDRKSLRQQQLTFGDKKHKRPPQFLTGTTRD